MSLEPARKNFTIYKNATFYKRVFFKVEGALQNLTGGSAELVIKNEPGGTTLLTLSSSTEGIALGGAAGTIDIEIPKATTATLTWEVGTYELRYTSTDPRTDVILLGGFKVVAF